MPGTNAPWPQLWGAPVHPQGCTVFEVSSLCPHVTLSQLPGFSGMLRLLTRTHKPHAHSPWGPWTIQDSPSPPGGPNWEGNRQLRVGSLGLKSSMVLGTGVWEAVGKQVGTRSQWWGKGRIPPLNPMSSLGPPTARRLGLA